MHIRRWLSFFALLSLWAVCISCGQNYRLPIIQIPGDPGDPKLYHFAMTISTNDPVANANVPGTVMQTDVAGDMDAGEAPVGRGPVFATLLPSGSANRIYVINSLEETVSTTTAAPLSCSPGPVCPIGAVATITLPAGSAASYLNSTEASNMYVILQNTNRVVAGNAIPPSVGVISVFQNTLTQEIVLPAGSLAVIAAISELPSGRKLYVVDQTNSVVYVINTVNRQVEQTLTVGPAPSMALASPDNSAVYVMTTAGITVIDALTDQVIPGTLTTGGQPNSVTYDTKLNHLYVTDTGGRVAVFDAAVAAGSLPTPLFITPAGSFPGAIGIAPLPDGTRFYVLANSAGTSLELTKVDSATFAFGSPYRLRNLTGSIDPPAVPYCVGRYRYMVGASGDSGRVYVSSCDAGGTYIFRTSDNTGVLLQASPNQPPVNGVFKPQNPVFLITGR
jgi:YVTN family beta-propeller protein